MKYLVKSRNNHYSFRIRTPKVLQSYFLKQEITKSLLTTDFNIAKIKVDLMYNDLEKIIQIKKLNMIDDDSIQKLVDTYIEKRLSRDYEARLNKVSLTKYRNKPRGKQPLVIRDILKDYKSDLSDFNVARVKELSEAFAEELNEKFDINNALHKKMSLEILRANISIYEEILARNKGDWTYTKTPTIHVNKKSLPSIENSIDEYLIRYENNAVSASANQIRDTKNFFIKIAKPLLLHVTNSLEQFDDNDIYDVRYYISKLLIRTGRNQNVAITEYLEKHWYEGSTYKKVSPSSANKYIKWLRKYFEFLKDKSYLNEDFSQQLPLYPVDAAISQREHLDKDEISILFNKTEGDINTILRILAYSGMRTSEVFKCTLEEHGSIMYFDLTEAQVKTISSLRKIPLHKNLSDITKNRLKELQTKYTDNQDAFSRKANQAINDYVSTNKKKVVYSLRHSFATSLKEAMIDETIIAELMGHSLGASLSLTRYASSYSLTKLAKAIEVINYESN